jgi:phosphatidylserine/phosphatidylglycerophosphate/cardiolipin synthase-like enzyme
MFSLIAILILLAGSVWFIFTGEDLLGLFAQVVNTQMAAPAPPTASAVQPPGGQAGDIPAWVQVYFTQPNPPDSLGNGIDRVLVKDLNAATSTIDLASFDFNLPSIVNALVEASQRGVKVRVVADEEQGSLTLQASAANGNQSMNTLKVLKAAKIKVVDGGRSNGLMHDKMIIVDGSILWMGSCNSSYNDVFRNNNNLLRITDSTVIANYQAKFNEMYVQKLFGAQAQVGALAPGLALNGVQVENYFSPVDEVMPKLVQYVRSARKSVRFYVFTYTHPDLSEAMIERFKAGLAVEGVIESRGATQGALVPLYCAKVPVKTDGNKYTMHHKVMVIDDAIVITGSFNFTWSADHINDDNVLIIHDPAIAALYLQEFRRVESIAQAPDPAKIDCSQVK